MELLKDFLSRGKSQNSSNKNNNSSSNNNNTSRAPAALLLSDDESEKRFSDHLGAALQRYIEALRNVSKAVEAVVDSSEVACESLQELVHLTGLSSIAVLSNNASGTYDNPSGPSSSSTTNSHHHQAAVESLLASNPTVIGYQQLQGMMELFRDQIGLCRGMVLPDYVNDLEFQCVETLRSLDDDIIAMRTLREEKADKLTKLEVAKKAMEEKEKKHQIRRPEGSGSSSNGKNVKSSSSQSSPHRRTISNQTVPVCHSPRDTSGKPLSPAVAKKYIESVEEYNTASEAYNGSRCVYDVAFEELKKREMLTAAQTAQSFLFTTSTALGGVSMALGRVLAATVGSGRSSPQQRQQEAETGTGTDRSSTSTNNASPSNNKRQSSSPTLYHHQQQQYTNSYPNSAINRESSSITLNYGGNGSFGNSTQAGGGGGSLPKRSSSAILEETATAGEPSSATMPKALGSFPESNGNTVVTITTKPTGGGGTSITTLPQPVLSSRGSGSGFLDSNYQYIPPTSTMTGTGPGVGGTGGGGAATSRTSSAILTPANMNANGHITIDATGGMMLDRPQQQQQQKNQTPLASSSSQRLSGNFSAAHPSTASGVGVQQTGAATSNNHLSVQLLSPVGGGASGSSRGGSPLNPLQCGHNPFLPTYGGPIPSTATTNNNNNAYNNSTTTISSSSIPNSARNNRGSYNNGNTVGGGGGTPHQGGGAGGLGVPTSSLPDFDPVAGGFSGVGNYTRSVDMSGEGIGAGTGAGSQTGGDSNRNSMNKRSSFRQQQTSPLVGVGMSTLGKKTNSETNLRVTRPSALQQQPATATTTGQTDIKRSNSFLVDPKTPLGDTAGRKSPNNNNGAAGKSSSSTAATPSNTTSKTKQMKGGVFVSGGSGGVNTQQRKSENF